LKNTCRQDSDMVNCPVCEDLAKAFLHVHGVQVLILEVYHHFHTCPICVAACEAGRKQIAENGKKEGYDET
jgi:hypothetical protein